MADRGPPGGEPARAMEDDPLDLAAEGVESGPESGPEVRGEEGLGEAMAAQTSTVDCVVCRNFGGKPTALQRPQLI